MVNQFLKEILLLAGLFIFPRTGCTLEQKTNLPTVYINTQNQAPINSKTVYVSGTMTIVSATDSVGLYNGPLQIRGRGNSTWNLQKKPYRIKLADETNLLGMPAKDDIWTLLANYPDKTLMRNALAFRISDLCQLYYTPAYRYVDLVLNNSFWGNYMLADQVERNKARVDIEKLDTLDTDPSLITGGYLLEIDGFGETTPQNGLPFAEAFTSQYQNKVSIKYPDEENINRQQRQYIINHYNSFEKAVMTFIPGKTDTAVLSNYLNFDSFVNWYIATEMTANPDCCWSIYLNKHRYNNQFYFGPLWDNDISFGNCNRLFKVNDDGRGESILVRCFNNGNAKNLVKAILAIPEIKKMIALRWESIKPGFKENLLQFIDSTANLLNQSQTLNYIRWPVLNTIVYNELAARGSYDAEVAFLRDYMKVRCDSIGLYLSNLDPTNPVMLFTPRPDVYYYLQSQLQDNYLLAEKINQGYRLAASTTLPSDAALARFEITYTKEYGEEAVYYFRNQATNTYIWMKNDTGSVYLDPIQKTGFTLYLSPNEANHFGLRAVSDNPSIQGKGIDSNGSAVVVWSTANLKGQREYQFIETTEKIVGIEQNPFIDSSDEMPTLYTQPGIIYFSNLKVGQLVRILSLDGRLITVIQAASHQMSIPVNPGIYVIVTGNQHLKVIVR